jgi:O-antigen/teichoic acid export membrane protein
VATTVPLSPEPGPGEPATLPAIGSVVGATVGGRFLRFAKTLAVARLLSPDSYGVFAALTVLFNYAQFLELGTSTAAFRDFASAVGRGDKGEAWRGAGRMASLKLAATVLLGVGAIAASFGPGVSNELRQGLLALPAIALSATLLSQALQHLQAEGRSGAYGGVTILAAAFDLVLCVGLTAAWGLAGLLAGAALAPLPALAWAARRRALAPPRAPAGPVLRAYLKTGLPLAGLALAEQSLLSVDQVLVMALLSLRELGLYNVAFVLAEAVRTLGVAAAAVLGPRLLREYARAGSGPQAVRRHTLNPVLAYANLLPVLIGPLWIAASFGVVRFFAAYAEAVGPMQTLLLATSFFVVLSGVTTFLFAIDKHPWNFTMIVPALVLKVIVAVSLLRLGWGLEGIAAASLVAYLGYAIAVLWYVTGHFSMARSARCAFLARAFLPLAVAGTGLWLIERHVPYRASLTATAATAAAVAALAGLLVPRALRYARQLDDTRER